MNEMYYYRAFGLTIESELVIPQVPPIPPCMPDVRIITADLSGEKPDRKKLLVDNGNMVYTTSSTVFRVTHGSLIEADIMPGEAESYVAVYLLGSCMGSILIQRGFMLLHGSCVTNGRHAVLITGDSGAGKSTMAAEFLKHGWKLITDDVTTVFDVETSPMVRSSYPSQKLWRDALEHYERPKEDVYSLFTTGGREKFGVDVTRFFHDGVSPLSMIVRLSAEPAGRGLYPMEGAAKIDQLMRNTYRINYIPIADRQRHFQRCVTLSTKIPMALAIRENGKDCAPVLYDMITKFMEETCHD